MTMRENIAALVSAIILVVMVVGIYNGFHYLKDGIGNPVLDACGIKGCGTIHYDREQELSPVDLAALGCGETNCAVIVWHAQGGPCWSLHPIFCEGRPSPDDDLSYQDGEAPILITHCINGHPCLFMK